MIMASAIAIFLLPCAVLAEKPVLKPLKTEVTPAVDGNLGDACWKKSEKLRLTPWKESSIGIPETFVQVVYTKNSVFFAFTCLEPKPDEILGGAPGIGNPWDFDSVELFLDTDSDKSNYVQFGLSAGGVACYKFADKPGNTENIQLGGIKYRTKVLADRWTAEIEIPFPSLSIKGQKLVPMWNVAFCRYRKAGLASDSTQYAIWQSELHEGLHHKPGTWADLGFFDVDFNNLTDTVKANVTGPGGWEYPSGVPVNYKTDFTNELDSSLAWVKTEKIRLLYGWLTSPMARKSPMYVHTFQQVVDVAAQAGFNVIVPIGSEAQGKKANPYRLWEAMDAMVRIRLAGPRTMFCSGYVWTPQDDPIGKLQRWVDRAGKVDATRVCPRNQVPWVERLVNPTLDALGEAKRLDVPELFFGVLFDVEFEANAKGECYCDNCWTAFANTCSEPPAGISIQSRHQWLMINRKFDSYKTWQEKATAEMIRQALAPLREKAPALVFCFYPYHFDDMWYTRAVLAGVSTPRAPGIPWDDNQYFTGYSGKPGHITATRKKTIEYLGYEPFYASSIDYAEESKYPSFTVERAARELYLITKDAMASITYMGSRNTTKDLLADQTPFFTDGFIKSHSLLANEGAIAPIVSPQPPEKLRTRLLKAQETLKTQIESMWGNTYGEALLHIDAAAIPPVFDGKTGMRLVKNPRGGFSHRKVEGDLIENGEGASYSFDVSIKQPPVKAILTVEAGALFPDETNILVKLNGERMALINSPQNFAGKKGAFNLGSVSIDIPPEKILEKNIVELAYFLKSKYEDTFFDNALLVKRVELRLE